MMTMTRGLVVLLMGIAAGGAMSLVPLEYALGGIQRGVPALGLGLSYLLYLHHEWRGVILMISLGVWALVMELIGTSTGWPYGGFQYEYELARELWGLVPITLGLIWPVLVLSMAARVRHVFDIRQSLWWIIAGTLALVGLDLLLDPVHVAQGIWSYTDEGARFGVPWTNYLGWLRTGGISMLITALCVDHKKLLPDLLVASGWFLWGYFGVGFVMLLL